MKNTRKNTRERAQKPVTKQSKPKRRVKLGDVELNEGPEIDAKRDAAIARFLSTPPKPSQSKRS